MSPSESDLRAALHDGEGGGLNVDHLIVNAQAAAAQRRVRLMSGAAIVAVVLGTGVGVGYLAGSNGTGGSAKTDTAGGGFAAGDSANGDSAGASAAGGQAPAASAPQHRYERAAKVACPTSFPNYLLPGGGGLSSYGANGPLFSKPVTSVVVCAYADARRSTSVRLSGASAAALVQSLDGTSKNVVLSCPYNPVTTGELAIVAFSRTGRPAGTVTAKPSGCGSDVTNGTAVRYGWRPSTEVRALLPKA